MTWGGSIPQQGMGPPVWAHAVLANSCQEDALKNASLGLAKKDEKLNMVSLGGELSLWAEVKRVTTRFWQFLKMKGTG